MKVFSFDLESWSKVKGSIWSLPDSLEAVEGIL